jgi:hypothetical protein
MNISQVVVFTQCPEFRMLLEIECRGSGGVSPLIRDSYDEFNSLISLLDKIDFLIIDEPEDSDLAIKLLGLIHEKKNSFKDLFLLVKKSINFEGAKVFFKKDLEKLIDEMKLIIQSGEKKTEGYISIPIDSLVHFKFLPFDLFVRISEEKFIKRIPAHEEIDDQTFTSFMQRGITELYFEKRFNRDFSMMLINTMINEVEKDYDSLNEKLTASQNVFNTTQQIVSKLGFKPKIVEVCESVLNQIMTDVNGGRDAFAKFLDQLRSQSDLNINYRLMELTCFTATQILNEIDQGLDPQKVKRIIFASMFCDFSLTEPNQINIRSQEQLQKLPIQSQKVINEHALRASELILSYENAPLEAASIIKQHHGAPNGIGFPTEISPKILPLAKVFMVAQEVAYQILIQSYRPPIDILSDLKSKYIDTPLEDYFVLFVKSCRPS